jgi:CRP/FNR family transcriptional regulator, cyclic AMP receptor protein
MTSLDILRREPDVRSFKQGDIIFKAGDPGDCMYAVVDGTVEIRIRGASVEQIAPGGVFGEMGLIDAQPRSADAVAATDCSLAVISEKRFLRLVEMMPQFALQMMRVITQRLRRQDRG